MAKRSAKKNEYSSAEQIGVIYARYSSHNQKEESIEQQIAECSDFAAKNGIRIVGIYADKRRVWPLRSAPEFPTHDAGRREAAISDRRCLQEQPYCPQYAERFAV
ncbi:MAG: recombinase family protein [Acutalibacteraceae bacterium]